MDTQKVYWIQGRIFIACHAGRKYMSGLVIEADGLHAHKVPLTESLPTAEYRGKPYPARKMRGHLRNMKAATRGAAKLKRGLLV